MLFALRQLFENIAGLLDASQSSDKRFVCVIERALNRLSQIRRGVIDSGRGRVDCDFDRIEAAKTNSVSTMVTTRGVSTYSLVGSAGPPFVESCESTLPNSRSKFLFVRKLLTPPTLVIPSVEASRLERAVVASSIPFLILPSGSWNSRGAVNNASAARGSMKAAMIEKRMMKMEMRMRMRMRKRKRRNEKEVNNVEEMATSMAFIYIWRRARWPRKALAPHQ